MNRKKYSSLKGHEIRAARVAANAPQSHLAAIVQTPPSVVSLIECDLVPITFNMGERLIEGLRKLKANITHLKNEPIAKGQF